MIQEEQMYMIMIVSQLHWVKGIQRTFKPLLQFINADFSSLSYFIYLFFAFLQKGAAKGKQIGCITSGVIGALFSAQTCHQR